MWLLLITLNLLFYILYFYWKRRHLYTHSKNVYDGGVREVPLLGTAYLTLFNDLYSLLTKFNAYPICKSWGGSFLIYGSSNPEYAKVLLNSRGSFAKMMIYKFMSSIFGKKGIFNADDKLLWRRHRKLLMPSFNPNTLKNVVPVFVKTTNTLCKILENDYTKNEEFNIFPELIKCTICSIVETATGIEISTKDACEIEEIFESDRMFHLWHFPDCIYKFSKSYKEEKYFAQKFDDFANKLIHQRKLQLSKVSLMKSTGFFDVFLEPSLSNEEIKQELQTVIFGGSDTSATAASFTFLMLAMHPEVQEKVYQEVVSVAGSDDLTPEDLSVLHYTERVIRETFRLFPVAPFLGRDVTEDIQLEDDLIIPRDSSVLVSVVSLHRNPLIWPEPLKFNPDRFLPEEVSKRHLYSFLPFSAGPRRCPGKTYGMLSLKTMVAMLTRKFQFYTKLKSVEEIELEAPLTLKAKGGFNVSIKLRKN